MRHCGPYLGTMLAPIWRFCLVDGGLWLWLLAIFLVVLPLIFILKEFLFLNLAFYDEYVTISNRGEKHVEAKTIEIKTFSLWKD